MINKHLVLTEWDEQMVEGAILEENPAIHHLTQALAQNEALTITELRRNTRLSTTSYVGKVRLGKLEITIQPKI